MKPLLVTNTVEQALKHLKEEIRTHRMRGNLPSERELMDLLGISRSTIRKVLLRLEAEGAISPASRGRGLCRRILEGKSANGTRKSLMVAVLLYEPIDRENVHTLSILMGFKLGITEAGHTCLFTSKSQSEMGYDPAKIMRFVKGHEADAWIVNVGSKRLLERFIEEKIPVLACGGQCLELPIAAAFYTSAIPMADATRHLLELGHRRIVYLQDEIYTSKPKIGMVATFFQTLEEYRIEANNYNLPQWEHSPEGLLNILDTLFRHTPPTALIVNEATVAIGILGFLKARGLNVPRDVSLISVLTSPSLDWYRPRIAHCKTEQKKLIQAMIRWVNSVANGNPHKRQMPIKMTYRPDGSVAPPPGK